MRNAFFEALLDVALADERVIFITGDLGFRVVEKFMEQRPRQFLNAGVAEASMTGLAAGMALSGKVVFTYSIANFPTLRCLEQIRADVCYHDADVKIVTVGGGFSYGAAGATHHAIEDLAIMRALPNVMVVAPGDPVEARAATRALVAHRGPAYLRLGKAGEPTVHPGPIEFRLGKAIRVREGSDLTLMSTGGMLQTAVKAADRLEAAGLKARVVSMHTLKPLDEAEVLAALSETGALFTLEEHSVVGGLGGAVAEVVAEAGLRSALFKRLGVASCFSPYMGSQEYLLAQHGLDPEGVARSVVATLRAGGRHAPASA